MLTVSAIIRATAIVPVKIGKENESDTKDRACAVASPKWAMRRQTTKHPKGAHDLHAWLSPKNAMTWLNVIAGQLSAADPDNAGAYFANAASGRTEIETLISEVNATLDPVRDSRFIVFHDACQYFEPDFDLPATGAISIGDASDPSHARIAEIQTLVSDQGIKCVLAEPQFNPGLVIKVLDGTEAQIGILDVLGSDLELGSALYHQLIRNLSTALAGCM